MKQFKTHFYGLQPLSDAPNSITAGKIKRILARVLTLLCIDFNMPRWEVMFSLVAMAILKKKEE